MLVSLLVLMGLPTRSATAVGAPSVNDGSGPLDTAADLESALRFEALIPEHTFGGMVTSLNYDAWPHLDPEAAPVSFDGEADSGNYTGNYLAALGWRYTQASAELDSLATTAGDRKGDNAAFQFWTRQRDEALTRAREIIGYYHVLVNIAEVWQTEFDPHIDESREPDEIGWIDFGGGLVPAEKGLLMRACTVDDAEPDFADVRVNYTDHHRLIGPLDWEGQSWHCLGGTSRDSYAGTIFGLSVALSQFGPDHPDLRSVLAGDLMAMTDYAAKYAWFQPRPHGDVANPALGHNDLDAPISPLFIQVPLHRLHLVQTARQAAAAVGDTEAAARYEVLWAAELASNVTAGQLVASMAIDAGGQHDAYYKYHLHLMSFFDVIRLESDPDTRTRLLEALAAMDASIRGHDNALYEAVVFALTGDEERLARGVRFHREWLDYYAFHEEAARVGNVPFLHSGRCAITEDPGPDAPIQDRPLPCVPKDQVDMHVTTPTGEVFTTPYRPGTDSAQRAAAPLPIGVRRYADYLWQKDPTIVGGDHATPWRGPSIDFLTVYWMLRYFSEVAPPAVEPLPAWAGPTFS